MDIKEVILTRKSVRTFDKRKITLEDKEKICAYMQNIDNPYGIPVKFLWLDSEANKLSSPVIKGEDDYIAAKVPNVEHCEEAYGYSFEKLVLYAWSLGIGTTWIGGTMKRAHFEAVAQTGADEIMMCVTPVGYPSEKKSLIDKTLRSQVKGDERLPSSEYFYEGDFSHPITSEDEILELVRWAPSAANMQPCRVVKDGNKYHFYKKSKARYKKNASWDVQKIDMGIALCHLMSVVDGDFEINDPGISLPENVEYIATVVAK
ncbi:MAG: nitroreductase family protein [Saccharofermentans sp.]|nr:nitroreductase family protein [Saccharofermentans sp.]